MTIAIPRRAFVQGLGLAFGGLCLGVFPDAFAADHPAKAVDVANPDHTLPSGGLRPNAFVHVAPDGVVSIVCKRSEMGQGVRSSLPVLIADELGASMTNVRVLQAPGDKAYGDQNTDGSHSVRGQYEEIRKLGATVRVLLVTAASRKWGVGVDALRAHDGRVFHQVTNRSIPFGDLVAVAAALPLPKPETVTLRPTSELSHRDAPIRLWDGIDIVTGKAQFGADVRLPDMVTAVMLHPPVVGGRVARYDASRALSIPGVKRVVEVPSPKKPPYGFASLGGLAVVADNTWAAMRGRKALDVTWDDGENASYDSDAFREQMARSVKLPGSVVRTVGDADAALAGAKTKLEAEYYVPHLAHAPMEPPVATARVTGDTCEVWATTQNPQALRTEVAKALDVGEEKVTVHVTLVGGGFGRKSKPDYAVEAALLAREMRVPVRLQWTREDDIQHDYFHSVAMQRIEAGLDESGKIVAYRTRIAFPPISSTFKAGEVRPPDGELGQGVLDMPITIPNVKAESCEAPPHVRIGWLRSVHNIHHAFAMCSFVDELAHARGVDPKEQWLSLLGPARLVTETELGVKKVPNYGAKLTDNPIDTARYARVLERVTALSGWSARHDDPKRGYGLAVHRSFLSYIAVVAAVVKAPSGKLKVDEAWMVADAGVLVNPERVRSQLEGAFVFGTSLTFFSQITAKRGAITQTNFRDYRLARIADAPREIHTELVDSSESSGGVGEPGVPPVAPAIVNAVFALTGIRHRALPLVNAGVV